MVKTRKKSGSSNKTKKHRTFGKKDFYSGDGFLTTIWGPVQWHMLHTISFNYPVAPTDQDRKHYKEFILNMQYTLPCKYCRMNIVKNFSSDELYKIYNEKVKLPESYFNKYRYVPQCPVKKYNYNWSRKFKNNL